MFFFRIKEAIYLDTPFIWCYDFLAFHMCMGSAFPTRLYVCPGETDQPAHLCNLAGNAVPQLMCVFFLMIYHVTKKYSKSEQLV